MQTPPNYDSKTRTLESPKTTKYWGTAVNIIRELQRSMKKASKQSQNISKHFGHAE